MKALAPRLLAAALLALVTWIVLSGASSGTSREPDKLVILSTTDVKGETSPCG